MSENSKDHDRPSSDMAGDSRSSKSSRKKSSPKTSFRTERNDVGTLSISEPFNFRQVQHVVFDEESRELKGLPAEWTTGPPMQASGALSGKSRPRKKSIEHISPPFNYRHNVNVDFTNGGFHGLPSEWEILIKSNLNDDEVKANPQAVLDVLNFNQNGFAVPPPLPRATETAPSTVAVDVADDDPDSDQEPPPLPPDLEEGLSRSFSDCKMFVLMTWYLGRLCVP
eukprot:TRINITY_DN4844_c0_g1_i2.p1 TRINITY_DN4844_c0_g1~~TRINITY_DN4844_c0_g1_i2.p1  ORF type:complete len:225 (-),score=47.72 TRINITY_DN4844_c0_g1_i2:136-810(-)